MKNKRIPALSAAILALLLASCDWEGGVLKWIDYDLRGTWESTEEDSWTGEKGLLVLDYDTVTITGTVAHLRGFTRGIALEAYTEDDAGETGLFYIKDRGVWQSPVTYRRWQAKGAPKNVELLTLIGGGAIDETFRKVGE